MYRRYFSIILKGAQHTLEQGKALKDQIENMTKEVQDQITQSSSQEVKDEINEKHKEVSLVQSSICITIY